MSPVSGEFSDGGGAPHRICRPSSAEHNQRQPGDHDRAEHAVSSTTAHSSTSPGIMHSSRKACRPYRAKNKGKVERPYRYIREDFFLARSFRNLDDLLGRCLPPDSCCRSRTRFLNYSPLRILP